MSKCEELNQNTRQGRNKHLSKNYEEKIQFTYGIFAPQCISPWHDESCITGDTGDTSMSQYDMTCFGRHTNFYLKPLLDYFFGSSKT